MRNITFSADQELIDKARSIAAQKKKSLNDEFRAWLANYAGSDTEERISYSKFVEQFPKITLPRKYTRQEMNERR